jgi:hypothetical protein
MEELHRIERKALKEYWKDHAPQKRQEEQVWWQRMNLFNLLASGVKQSVHNDEEMGYEGGFNTGGELEMSEYGSQGNSYKNFNSKKQPRGFFQ